MQVKIELARFEGFADLSGTELEALAKILSKFARTEQSYVGERYVHIRNGEKVQPKIEVMPDTEFMTQEQFNVLRAAEQAEEARVAEEQRQARQVAMEIAMAAQDNASTETLVKLLEEQSLLYWQERPAQNPTRFWAFDEGCISFVVGPDDKLRKIVIKADGTFQRKDI